MGAIREAQTEIAEAINDADMGITGFVDAPAVLAPGVAWSRLVDMETAGPNGVMLLNLEIVVILAQTPEQAVGFIDSVMPELLDALAGPVYIRRISYAEFRSGGEPLFGVLIDCARE